MMSEPRETKSRNCLRFRDVQDQFQLSNGVHRDQVSIAQAPRCVGQAILAARTASELNVTGTSPNVRRFGPSGEARVNSDSLVEYRLDTRRNQVDCCSAAGSGVFGRVRRDVSLRVSRRRDPIAIVASIRCAARIGPSSLRAPIQ
jgi:hypothetical protein